MGERGKGIGENKIEMVGERGEERKRERRGGKRWRMDRMDDCFVLDYILSRRKNCIFEKFI